jgi:hypothetical protein
MIPAMQPPAALEHDASRAAAHGSPPREEGRARGGSGAGGRKPSSWVARLAWLGVAYLAIHPAVYWKGGLIEREATVRTLLYLDERSLAEKVFDPQLNEFGDYQGRELSFFVDLCDAYFYALLARARIDFFVPLSGILASLLFVLVYFVGARSVLRGLDGVLAPMVLMLFMTSFVFISTTGTFYRCTKTVIAPFLLAFMFYALWLDRRRPAQRPRWLSRHGLAAFALCLVVALLDRTGLFYVLTVCSILSLHALLRRRLLDVAVAAAAAGALAHVYVRWVGRWIVRLVNGYWPSLSFQDIDYTRLFSEPIFFREALRLMADNTVAMLGGTPVLAALGALAVVALWLAGRSRPRGIPLGPVYAGIAFALQAFMYTAMAFRHPSIFEMEDHRYWYYPLPYVVTLLFAVAVLADHLARELPRAFRRLPHALVAAGVVGNLVHLDDYRSQLARGVYFGPVYAQSVWLKGSLEQRSVDPRLAPEYRIFLGNHRKLRKAGGRGGSGAPPASGSPAG